MKKIKLNNNEILLDEKNNKELLKKNGVEKDNAGYKLYEALQEKNKKLAIAILDSDTLCPQYSSVVPEYMNDREAIQIEEPTSVFTLAAQDIDIFEKILNAYGFHFLVGNKAQVALEKAIELNQIKVIDRINVLLQQDCTTSLKDQIIQSTVLETVPNPGSEAGKVVLDAFFSEQLLSYSVQKAKKTGKRGTNIESEENTAEIDDLVMMLGSVNLSDDEDAASDEDDTANDRYESHRKKPAHLADNNNNQEITYEKPNVRRRTHNNFFTNNNTNNINVLMTEEDDDSFDNLDAFFTKPNF